MIIRPYQTNDQQSLAQMLVGGGLGELYPDFYEWLPRRLAECASGQAWCWLAEDDGAIVGAVIVSPKKEYLKLSTLYVAAQARHHEIGSALLSKASSLWAAGEYRLVVMTVAPEHLRELAPLAGRYGFLPERVLSGRYGRDEILLVCHPEDS